MSSTVHDPRLLYSINNILAFHIQHGEETELTPSGPQTLSLLMVPTSTIPQSPSAEASSEEDFYLHLHLPPELDLALPATTQIYHQPPNSYLIPRWDLGPDAGAFIRIQFPGIGSGPGKVTQEDVDTFETILAQCTAFLERAPPPPKGHAAYNPAEYAPGEGYVSSPNANANAKAGEHGAIVLIDEENGSVVGEMEGYDVVEKPGVKPGSKNPVEIQLPAEGEGNQISVSNVSEEYLRMARHPAYKGSTIVQTSATASRLVVTGSSYLASALTNGADSFTKKTKPNPKPMTFSETTQSRIRKIGNFSHGAADISAKTVGQVNKYAQSFGASMSRRKEDSRKRGVDKTGNGDYKPGVLNKSMIAFSTLADGIEQGARTVLTSGSEAASTMIGHRYGDEAGAVASNVTGGFKNVGLVYIDASGVSRKALIKSVAKGMVVGRMRNGRQVLVGTGDGGEVPSHVAGSPGPSGQGKNDPVARRPSSNATPPPAYSASGTRSVGGTPMSGGKR
ncbi:hypothetical protein ASPWEDRAFT_171783 [Aspergillus wentii DTO 134E9]|uniref:Senescence domain-containing protein n=1 Tax=Aspergillus wentii DTO 134E9 TaxID=1073089 RepID=A0A1L9RJ43_ASPWE|nr:uncharacterized protein ASPWEDRAFT_171783 [Aspergillus wentii DTO 134E9]KAI9932091.1 hypothetical protein MW887_009600 [Aspergillus wentii]OJJ34952.1 hypothetical protein ASPWEDRAFT_171783 [Aspergillus wentii DTO 134E9]